ncbi:DUF6185 family protein [Streptomyces narbonensis]
MIRPGWSAPRCLQVLLLLLCLVLPAVGEAAAAQDTATACRADQLKKAKVTALAEFKHRGNNFSMVTSTMDISVPTTWTLASDLLLDSHSLAYRSALGCLVGKPSDEKYFPDDEWRFKPVAVKADGQWVKVHYQAVNWIQFSSFESVGPWDLALSKENWSIELRPSPALKGADWDRVQVDLGGRGALTATPPPVLHGAAARARHPLEDLRRRQHLGARPVAGPRPTTWGRLVDHWSSRMSVPARVTAARQRPRCSSQRRALPDGPESPSTTRGCQRP